MQIARISNVSYRPQVIRVGPNQRASLRNSTINDPGWPISNSIDHQQSHALRELRDSMMIKKNLNARKQSEKNRACRRMWFIFCLTTTIAMLLATLIGLLLGFEIHFQTTTTTTVTTGTTTTATTATSTTATTSTSTTSTSSSTSSSTSTSTTSKTTSTSSTSTTSTSSTSSTSTTSTTATTSTTSVTTSTTTTSTTTTTTTQTTTTTSVSTTAPSCTTLTSTIFSVIGTGPPTRGTPWTLFNITYAATQTTPTLIFAFLNGGGDSSYLDAVSVVDNSAPGVELLDNPSFENTTSGLTGWITWCQNTCTGSNDEGHAISGTCHTGSGTYCYMDHCQGGMDYLAQSFSAIVGHTYRISFWIYQVVGPAGQCYVLIR